MYKLIRNEEIYIPKKQSNINSYEWKNMNHMKRNNMKSYETK